MPAKRSAVSCNPPDIFGAPKPAARMRLAIVAATLVPVIGRADRRASRPDHNPHVRDLQPLDGAGPFMARGLDWGLERSMR